MTTFDEITAYAQQVSGARAKVEQINRSILRITFTSTRLNSNKLANLARQAGARKAFDIVLSDDGKLAIEIHLKKDARLPYDPVIKRARRIIEKSITDSGMTIEDWMREHDAWELPSLDIGELLKKDELNDILCAPAHTSHETK